MVGLAQSTIEIFRLKEEAGKATKLEVNKADIALAMTEIDMQKAQSQLISQKARLSAWWGSRQSSFTISKGALPHPAKLPSFDSLITKLKNNPSLSLRDAEVQSAKTALKQGKAEGWPDMNISVGYRYFNPTQDHAALVGAGFEIPLFDRNQGEVTALHHEIRQAKENQRENHIQLSLQLTSLYQGLTLAHSTATSLLTRIIPQAQETYEAVLEGYRLGRFGYLELLDAQRTFFEVRKQAVDARSTLFKNIAEIEMLIGEALIPEEAWIPQQVTPKTSPKAPQ